MVGQSDNGQNQTDFPPRQKSFLGGVWSFLTKIGHGADSAAHGTKDTFNRVRFVLTGEDSEGFILTASGHAQQLDMRAKTAKCLKSIEEEGFYTLGGVVSLMRQHYVRQRDEAFEKMRCEDLSEAERQKWAEIYEERLKDTEKRLKHKTILKQLRKLLKAAEEDRISMVPKGTRMVRIYEFLQHAGFLDAKGLVTTPLPMKYVEDKPRAVKLLIYRGAGDGDAFYHSARVAMGGEDPAKYLNDEPYPFAGAVYQTYLFDNPYLKRGTLIVRNGDERGPIDVEYFEGWSQKLDNGEDIDEAKYEEYYRGYLLDQGYDSYVFLFGPQKQSVPFTNDDEVKLVFEALEHLAKGKEAPKGWCKNRLVGSVEGEEEEYPNRAWDAKNEPIELFLQRLDPDFVLETLENYYAATGHSAVPGSHGGPAAQLPGAGTSGMEEDTEEEEEEIRSNVPALAFPSDSPLRGVFNSSLLKQIASFGEQRTDPGEPPRDKAIRLKKVIWDLFEVDGKPGPKPGEHRRVRTMYMQGIGRTNLTPSVVKGSVMAFDNNTKADMLMERTIMYRLGGPSTNAMYLARLGLGARWLANRFDMRQPDDHNLKLADFEPNYREIFLALGYDVGGTAQRKSYRIDPVVSQTASEPDEIEIEYH